jgi:drug/metabolite transporter superfamily protein YnfA
MQLMHIGAYVRMMHAVHVDMGVHRCMLCMHARMRVCTQPARVHVCMCVYVDVVVAWTMLLHTCTCIYLAVCTYILLVSDAHTYGRVYAYGPAICKIRSEDDVLVSFYLPGQSACMVGQVA